MYPSASSNIREILTKVAQGDERAFTLLFNQFYSLLERRMLYFTKSEQLAQEIALDVFLNVWINRRVLQDITCFKSYLLIVSRNHAFNCLKKHKREDNRRKQWMENTVLFLPEQPEDTFDYYSWIDAAVESLPPQQKKIYVLSRSDKMKQAQIAKELDIALETVKKHMVLALRNIKSRLRDFAV
ncbi:RNA polymerase subunit sigma-24 [Pedobacter sp. HMWF019]|uniref:RNA polymerase sigma factor n=1 Tax=Pedobacter sp. HMWF019 TaxID=2056856 RepID=UPI000D345B9A|nr:sigma-70 family RNA polymerase sigma factor [Pedobacter sp. HMWF019]PTS96332.1 RNA polymerase subunit sigma-24 [Pedobacter sp. HMWF019]